MKTYLLYLKTTILILLFSVSIQAEDIVHLETEKGLVNGTVTSMVEDSLGYMWVGTKSGLYRYSGERYLSYQISEKETNQFITALIKKDGDIYAISRKGVISKYDYIHDSFELIAKAEKYTFTSAKFVNDNEILLGLRNGVTIYNMESKTFAKKVSPSKLLLCRDIIKYNGKIYVGGAKGLFELVKGIDNKYSIKEELVKDIDILTFNIDSKGRFWITTNSSELFLYDYGKLTPLKLNGFKNGKSTIREIFFDNNDNALLGVDGDGLFVVDQHFNVIAHYNHNPDDPSSLRQNDLETIYVDKNNVYWLGHKEMGVDILFTEDNPFTNYQHILNLKNSLSDNFIRSILRDDNGNIWFGTESGIDVLSPNGQWQKLNTLINTPVLTLNKYKGEILVGTYGKGSFLVDPKTYKARKAFEAPERENIFVFTTQIIGDDVWVGGNNAPLSLFTNDKYQRNYKIGYVKSIVARSENLYIVASLDGAHLLNKTTGEIKKLEGKSSAIKTANAFALLIDNEREKVWIGGGEGLQSYNFKTDKLITHFTNGDVGIIYGLNFDQNGNLWLSSSQGLYKYNMTDNHLRRFGKKDGVEISNFGFGASLKLQDGSLMFGGAEGAIKFNPSNIKKNYQKKNVIVDEFKINGQQVDYRFVDNLNFNHELTLNHDQNTVMFSIIVPDLYGKNQNIIKYQLEGYDDKPIILINGGQISYTKLPAGDYKLVVDVINSDGVVSDNVYELNLDIKDPWWLSPIAFLMYMIITLGIFFLIMQVQKAKHQQNFSDEKIKFFVNVAHDIRTPVSLIQLSADQLAKGENGENAISLIRRNTKHLNEYVTQLLDFQKAERNQLELKVQEIDLKSLMEEVLLDFKPMIENKELTFNFSMASINVWFDKEKMVRVFNNLISNAIKYSHQGGTVKINIEEEKGKVLINFIDNGIGIPENQQKKIFTRFVRANNAAESNIAGSGIGLLLAKKIVELHRGTLEFESKVDLGTKFTISLSLGKGHFMEEEILKVIVEEEEHLPTLNINEEKTILVVEDNDDIRKTLVEELSKDYKILEAPNGKEALVIALEKRPDLVITDVMMPLMSGKELCHILKNNYKTSHIPVVMLTALSRVEDKIEGLELGADAYVEKPFRMEMLRITINNLLKSRHLIKKLMTDQEEEETEPVSAEQDFLSKVVEEIKSNVTNKEFNIVTLCENLGYSRSNLFRKLKKHSGMSPSDLIIKIRINHAIELFKTRKDLRVADVAYESGFNDPKYFSTTFKKHIGKTPKEYIESIREEIIF
ncbi:ATP-binding protein [Flammeovirga sp. SubArs3]|uniref:hybrid sensor histidine kinase/response regulator transcription factor n=1 Tax=Flammeovirga sp. SubArs3 TaxID=2995316 RepID=UPI00248C1AD1|nr:ATP-binding protein [Flammeovirga sp. SubArs3]